MAGRLLGSIPTRGATALLTHHAHAETGRGEGEMTVDQKLATTAYMHLNIFNVITPMVQ